MAGQFYKQVEREAPEMKRRLRVMRAAAGRLGANGKGATAFSALAGQLEFFERELPPHLRQEERVLFPFVNSHFPRLESLTAVLASEHEEFRSALTELKMLVRACARVSPGRKSEMFARLRVRTSRFTALLRSHMYIEESAVYEAVDHELKPMEKSSLLKSLQGNGHARG